MKKTEKILLAGLGFSGPAGKNVKNYWGTKLRLSTTNTAAIAFTSEQDLSEYNGKAALNEALAFLKEKQITATNNQPLRFAIAISPEWRRHSLSIEKIFDRLLAEIFTQPAYLIQAVPDLREGLNSLEQEKYDFLVSLGSTEQKDAVCLLFASRTTASFLPFINPLATISLTKTQESLQEADLVTFISADKQDIQDRILPAHQQGSLPRQVHGLTTHNEPERALPIAILDTALCLYHKIIVKPVTAPADLAEPARAGENAANNLRPWLRPLPPERLSLQASSSPRQAAVILSLDNQYPFLILEEPATETYIEAPFALPDWDCEIFPFAANSIEELLAELEETLTFLASASGSITNLAFYRRSKVTAGSFVSESFTLPQFRVCITATTKDELKNGTQKIIEHIIKAPDTPLADTRPQPRARCFYAPVKERKKVAMVMPGLGSAYPGMLYDLCQFLPEVREVFDFVDYLAKEAGDTILPSNKIFASKLELDLVSDAATLASADYAVVTVLLAEWALHTVLTKLGIRPDATIGCSTGEFAALSMAGAADIVSGAKVFYELSTKVARSVSEDKLSSLKTIKINNRVELLPQIIAQYPGRIFLSGALTPSNWLISAYSDDMTNFCRMLKEHDVSFTLLPLAIPYHTELVSGVVSTEDSAVRSFAFASPHIPVWACSTASTYPSEPDAIRKLSTKLFERPILLTDTIKAVYRSGIDTFVEIGPKGLLAQFIGEILSEHKHLAIGTNSVVESGLKSLLSAVAALYCSGHDIHWDFLNRGRNISAQEEQDLSSSFSTNRIFESPPTTESSNANVPADQPITEELAACNAGGQDEQVMISYLQTLKAFQTNLLRIQESVMTAYLSAGLAETQPGSVYSSGQDFISPPTTTETRTSPSGELLPLLKQAHLKKFSGSEVTVELNLRLDKDCYLLDHAIGSAVQKYGRDSGHKVYLLPLMVALEIMAEALATLAPISYPLVIENVRARKRIRVKAGGRNLRITARGLTAGTGAGNASSPSSDALKAPDSNQQRYQVDIFDNDDAVASMSAEFVLGSNELPATIAMPAQAPPPKIAGQKLYDKSMMFHGPRLQAVKNLIAGKDRELSGWIEPGVPSSWFVLDNESNQPHRNASQTVSSESKNTDYQEYAGNKITTICDPQLLDNASQLVLFYLFEQNIDVLALLPFFIEKIVIGSLPPAFNQPILTTAQLTSVTSLGTEASLSGLLPSGQALFSVAGIHSRKITLPSQWKTLVHAPEDTFFSQMLELDLSSQHKDSYTHLYACSVDLSEKLIDDITLDWLIDYVLSEEEEKQFRQLKSNNRKREWLAGRLAAKDAVRQLFLKYEQIKLLPADVEILSDMSGRPVVNLSYLHRKEIFYNISITHSNNFAAAIAALSTTAITVGIDAESVLEREDGFTELAFSPAEQILIAQTPQEQKWQLVTQLWCAKEAAAKALNRGLNWQQRLMETRLSTSQTNLLEVSIPQDSNQNTSVTVQVKTLKKGAYIIAGAAHRAI